MDTDGESMTIIEQEDSEDLDLMLTNSFVTEDFDATEERLTKSNSVHACKVCEDVFRCRQELVQHMQDSYNCRTKKLYRCVQCQDIFPNVGSFQLHLVSHFQENSESGNSKDGEFSKNVCELCGKDFTTQQLKKKHIEIHFDQRGSVLCPICGKCITSKDMYHRHNLMHNYKSSKKRRSEFECHICHENQKGARRLREHLRSHTEEPSFECHTCNKTFGKKGTLRMHIKKSHYKPSKPMRSKRIANMKKKTT
ncbi:unnamed protein product [Phyllotreta striolata]|uniref:C2H2-type domain-containing protein n=1 Tax=Phyllotreta striolata TaxID=444603 RepID=A0A9N9XRN2_PHYSR|nr:unnamed protein product [Phyllotreta striolata]